ncbi:Fur family transcriptional regulator [Ectopseudomonas hydrolytica]|uniref:Fur family transcriptional regulator n=1 Tax=Ectopseudomonas hydrolytica TaxID=2493633 RepID=A0ABY5A217_9GAMM|nr:hypothetical protein [Pseudomonas hydrolytica]OCX15291.1 hypothetical protein BBI09_16030 [Stutzerimonas xanthomarina]USR37668.1 Fur family transcriptional regulator [Pseudomonas hydrolytica]
MLISAQRVPEPEPTASSVEPDPRLMRELLHAAGLRTTLTRQKVAAVLYSAGKDGVSVKDLHQKLAVAGEPLDVRSVRQVLSRLKQKGLLVLQERGRYCFAPDILCPPRNAVPPAVRQP